MWQDNEALIGRRASRSGETEGEKIAAIVLEQEKIRVQETTWENLGDPAANGEGWGRSHVQGLKDWNEMEEG